MMSTQKNVASHLNRMTWTHTHTHKLGESGKRKSLPSGPPGNRGQHQGSLPNRWSYPGQCPWRETKRPDDKMPAIPRPSDPAPLSRQPALTSAGLSQMCILTASCQSWGCLLRDQKKAPRDAWLEGQPPMSSLDLVPLSEWHWPVQHLLYSPCPCPIA